MSRSANKEWTDLMSKNVLSTVKGFYPYAEIDRFYTCATIEGSDEKDAGILTLQVTINLGERVDPAPKWVLKFFRWLENMRIFPKRVN